MSFTLKKSHWLKLLMSIYLVMGAFWTYYSYKGLFAVPWGIFAIYIMVVLFLLSNLLVRFSYQMPLSLFLSLFITMFSLFYLRLFSYSEVITTRSALFFKESVKDFKNQDIYGLNGWRLDFQIMPNGERTHYNNQGFSRLGEEANINHIEVLNYLKNKEGKKINVKLKLKLEYRFWAFDRFSLVGIDDIEFKNFKYMPNLPIPWMAGKSKVIELKKVLPDPELMNISL